MRRDARSVDDAVLIAGLFRALVDEAIVADESRRPARRCDRTDAPRRDVAGRAARAARRRCCSPAPGPTPAPAAERGGAMVDRLRPHLEDSGDWDDVDELAPPLLARGESARPPAGPFAERGRIADVVALLVAESPARRAPSSTVPGDASVTRRPTTRHRACPASRSRPTGRARGLDELGPAELGRRSSGPATRRSRDGFTFGVDGAAAALPRRPGPAHPASHEWAVLSTGLVQRARAIEMFLRDVYGPAQIVPDGLVDRAILDSVPGWRPEARRCPTTYPGTDDRLRPRPRRGRRVAGARGQRPRAVRCRLRPGSAAVDARASAGTVRRLGARPALGPRPDRPHPAGVLGAPEPDRRAALGRRRQLRLVRAPHASPRAPSCCSSNPTTSA